KIRGEGDAMAARIYAEAYGQDPEFYAFLRRMEAYEKMVSERDTLVLDARSDLLRYLESATGQPTGQQSARPRAARRRRAGSRSAPSPARLLQARPFARARPNPAANGVPDPSTSPEEKQPYHPEGPQVTHQVTEEQQGRRVE